jgi:branched-chain amino acid transport system substrate-binding protein
MLRFLSKIFLILIISTSICSAEETDVVKIGWIGPLTGNSSALGVDSVVAVQMVFDRINKQGEINGRQLEIVVEDDQYITSKTVSAYKKLVFTDKVQFIFVITYGGLFAVAEQAQRDNVLLVDPLDCDDNIAKLPENTFCLAKKTEDLAYLNAVHATNNKFTPTGIIYFDGDPFMGNMAKASSEKFTDLGKPIDFSESYNSDTTDFKPLLLKAKTKNLNSIFFYGYDQMGTAMTQARELGLKMQFYSMGTIMSPGFRELAGTSANGTFVGVWMAPKTPRYFEFIKSFKTEVGREPFLEISTIPSYDAAEILVEGLKDSLENEGSRIDIPKLKTHFYKTKNYSGLSGSITVDEDGIVRSLENKMYVYKNGKLDLIEHPQKP